MKCDELSEFRLNASGVKCYLKTEVDTAIDELKMEHHRERDEYIDWVNKLQRENAELKGEIARLESVRKVHIEGIESMAEGLKLDAEKLRKTQRALWLARAYIMTLLQRDFQRLAYQCNSTDYKKNLLKKRNHFYDLSEKFSAKAKEYE